MENFPHVPDYAEQFLQWLKSNGRKESTLKRYYYDLQDFFAWMRVYANGDSLYFFNKIQYSDLQQYFHFLSQQRKYREATLRRIETVIKRLTQFLISSNKSTQKALLAGIPDKRSGRVFTEEDFVTDMEMEKLLQTIQSLEGLTDKQLKYRHLLIKRNESIVTLLYHYGLSLKEVTDLTMNHIHFSRGMVSVIGGDDSLRTLKLNNEHQKLIHDYYVAIPEPVRPRQHTKDPLFAAFDYQRGTYRFDYSQFRPKPLTVIAIQKMIRQEVKRAGLRKGISAQHFRRTCILKYIQKGLNDNEIQEQFGLRAKLTLVRYFEFYEGQIKEKSAKS